MISPGSPSKVPELPSSAAAPEGFSTSMVHLYRAEMHRMTAWRQRLDVTSDWAIILTMAITTFALGSHGVPHFVLLLVLAIIAISILMVGIGNGRNAGLLALRILAIENPVVRRRCFKFRKRIADESRAKNRKLIQETASER